MKKVIFASIAAAALAMPVAAFAVDEMDADTTAAAEAAPAAGEMSYTLEDGKKVTVKNNIAWIGDKYAPKGTWKTKEGKTLMVKDDKGMVEVK